MARQFQHTQTGGALVLPTGCVDDEAVTADSPLGVTKTRHLHKRSTNFGVQVGGAPANGEFIVHRASAAETVKNFRVMMEETGTTTSVAYDLKKYNAANPGGITILSGVVTITNATVDRSWVNGVISNASLVDGDVLTISQTITSVTGAAGPFAEIEIDAPYI